MELGQKQSFNYKLCTYTYLTSTYFIFNREQREKTIIRTYLTYL